MRAKNNLRLFQDERVAMLCNDAAAGKMVAQRLFQRFGYTLYSLTCAHNVHVFNLCQIIDGHSLLRVVIGLKPCIARIQPVSLQMQQTAGVHVRVRRLQTVLHDIRHNPAAFFKAMRNDLFPIQDSHRSSLRKT